MLILSRHKNQRIVIGNVTVTVVRTGAEGGSVRLGIEAPKDVAIYREELRESFEKKPGPVLSEQED